MEPEIEGPDTAVEIFMMKLFGIAACAIVMIVPISCGGADEPSPARAAAVARTSGATAATIPDSVQRIRAAVARLEEADAFPPATPAELASRLGGDPRSILEYVRTRLRYDPYAGILRGGRGALLTGGGNDLDLMLLLRDALLSADPNLSVRYARASMEGQALASVRPGEPFPDLDPAEIARITGYDVAEVTAALRDPGADPELEELSGRIDEETVFIQSHLATRPNPTGAPSREHWWLRARFGGQWIDLDPLAESDGMAPTPMQEVERLPPELHHRIGIRLVLERLRDGELEEEILYRQSWDTAALAGEDLTLTILPEGFDPARLAASLAGAERFQAALRAPGGVELSRVFDLEGSVYEAQGSEFVKGAGGGAAALGQGVFGMLSGGPGRGESATPRLAGLRIEIEITSPGERPRVHHRWVVDRIDRAALSNGEARLLPEWSEDEPVRRALVRSIRLLPLVGPIDEAWVVRDQVALILDETLAGATEALIQEGRVVPPAEIRSADLLPAMRLAGIARLGQALAGAGSSGMLVHGRPGAILIRESLEGGSSGPVFGTAVDVVAGGVLTDQAAAALRYGVALSYAEAHATEPPSIEAAIEILSAARRQGRPFRLLTSVEGAVGMALPAAARDRLREQLAAGFLALVPESGAAPPAWWRIDPSTGIPIATGATGEGQAIIEGTSILRDISIPQVERTLKYVLCLNQSVAGGASINQAGGQCLCEYVGSQMPSAGAYVRARAVEHVNEIYGLSAQVEFILAQGLEYTQTYGGISDVPWSRACDAMGLGGGA
ncbi:MAG: hypothetical protein ACREMD_10290 [Gemmatimonadota bacterium]